MSSLSWSLWSLLLETSLELLLLLLPDLGLVMREAERLNKGEFSPEESIERLTLAWSTSEVEFFSFS